MIFYKMYLPDREIISLYPTPVIKGAMFPLCFVVLPNRNQVLNPLPLYLNHIFVPIIFKCCPEISLSNLEIIFSKFMFPPNQIYIYIYIYSRCEWNVSDEPAGTT